jgi:hypothetical protein
MRCLASSICPVRKLLTCLCDWHALKGIRYCEYGTSTSTSTVLVLVVPVALCSSLVWKGELDGGGWQRLSGRRSEWWRWGVGGGGVGGGGGGVAAGMLGTTNPKSEDFSETLASGARWG